MSAQDELFHPVIELPEPVRAARYDRLVGLDHIKSRLRKEATLLASPRALQDWAKKHHVSDLPALTLLQDRAPLLLFAGDVGSGKSALAESFGCDLSSHLRMPVSLYRLKLSTRGSGLVGEMTTLVSDAFAHLAQEGKRAVGSRGVKSILVMVVDEADALVQSREASQMHHEDRAGVDAFLAGIDGLAGLGLPVIVVLCTNRLSAIDPALRRRAAATFEFHRPDGDQRHAVLTSALDGLSLAPGTIVKMGDLTGPEGSQPGFTYSDLTQRLVPSLILEAFPDAVTDDLAVSVAQDMQATPVFLDES
jgi:AAA+ superfamily predicted ATPase